MSHPAVPITVHHAPVIGLFGLGSGLEVSGHATVTVSAIWRPPVVTVFVPQGIRVDATAVSRTIFGS